MVTPNTGRAIDAYRKVMKAEFRVEELKAQLERLCHPLDINEWDDYVELTQRIDAAADAATVVADESRWAPSTRKQAVVQAINAAGLG